jgi:hypothetical protein
MSLSNGVITVGTAATPIDDVASANPTQLHIHNNDNSDAVFIGGPDVTTSTGLQLLKLETVDFILRPGNKLYAVSSKADHSISFIKQDY